jgi:hypothetical protein
MQEAAMNTNTGDLLLLRNLRSLVNDVDPVASHPIVANGRYVDTGIDWNEAVVKARVVKAQMIILLDDAIREKTK